MRAHRRSRRTRACAHSNAPRDPSPGQSSAGGPHEGSWRRCCRRQNTGRASAGNSATGAVPGNGKHLSRCGDVFTYRCAGRVLNLVHGVTGHGCRPQLCLHLDTIVFDGGDVFTQSGKCRQTGKLTHQSASHQTAQYTLCVAARRFHCSCVLITVQGENRSEGLTRKLR